MTTIKIPAGSNLDPYLKANRIRTRFELEPGTYTCGTGWEFDREFDHVCLAAGCELIGAGANETNIRCNPPEILPQGARQIEGFTVGERHGTTGAPCLVRGVTLDITSSDPSLGLIGLHSWCYRVTLDDIRILGVRGDRASGNEGFGILVNGCGPDRQGGANRITNCRVLTDGGYVCGIYVGIETPHTPSYVENCTVGHVNRMQRADVPLRPIGHAAFGTNGGVFWDRCSNQGRWERAIFCDTAGGSGTLFSGCHLRAERVLVEFRGDNGMVWRDIIVQASLLEITPAGEDRKYAAALVLANDGPKPGPAFNGVRIVASTIRADEGIHYLGSSDSQKTIGSGVQFCNLVGLWASPIQGEGCYFGRDGNL